MKKRLVHLACLFILLPVLPIFFLRTALQACVDFLDWTTEGRAWCQPFVDASEWFGNRFDPPRRRPSAERKSERS